MTRHNRIQWFQELLEATKGMEHQAVDLMAQIKIGESRFQSIRAAAKRYIASCLGVSDAPTPEGGVVPLPLAAAAISEEALLARLESHVDELANRTPNGELLPKREFEAEFNAFHGAVAAWLKDLRIDPLIHQISCPVAIRIVKGTSDSKLEQRPYSSSKLHVDLWNGDPADNINVLIPLWGDVERTTVEFFRPPDDFEERFLRMISDYGEASTLIDQCQLYPMRFRLGYAHFIDAVVPHRTVKRGGTLRVSIQLQLRRKTTPEAQAHAEAICDRDRLQRYYLASEDWYALGIEKYLKFSDTYADAKRGVFMKNPYRDAMYEIVDAL